MSKLGYRQTTEHRAKIRKSCSGPRPHTQGKNHWRWKGGRLEIRKKNLEKLETIAGRKKPNKCDVCKLEGRICFDHDHNTGKFRGWLCEHCNVILGFAGDDSNLLINLAKYLNDNEL